MKILIGVLFLGVSGSGWTPTRPAGAAAQETTETPAEALECGLSYEDALEAANTAWAKVQDNFSNRVELLAFEGTLLHKTEHPSLRRSLRPLTLVEGTTVTGMKHADLALKSVSRINGSHQILFAVKLRPLEIRGSLKMSDQETHLLRCYLVDLSFRFRTEVETGHTTYGLQRAGHVTVVQVANGDRTESSFGQDLEALLAGAAVTAIFHELKRSAGIHHDWVREPPLALQWDPYQVPDSWPWEGRQKGVGARP